MADEQGEEIAATLLVVDDDEMIRSLLAQSLSKRGYRLFTASNAAEMDRIMARESVDVIILDIMMPGEDGIAACRRIAAADGPPVILLSALSDEQDRIVGLEVGADRHLSKPCSPREVLAHVRAVLRRQQQAEGPRKTLYFREWRIDLESNELFDANGVLVHLTDGEFSVLRVLVERPRRVLSRDDLIHAARGRDSDVFDRAIDIQISRLRRKLKSPGDSLIRTVRNEGYMLVSKVSSVALAP